MSHGHIPVEARRSAASTEKSEPLIPQVTEMTMDDDDKDNSNDGNVNCMKSQEFDCAFCENVLHILNRTLPKPRFRDGADQFRLAGTMESDPLEALNEAS